MGICKVENHERKAWACFNCGQTPTGYWHGDHATIAACKRCAIDVLSKLIADSVAGNNYEAITLIQFADIASDQMLKSFWCALFHAAETRPRR